MKKQTGKRHLVDDALRLMFESGIFSVVPRVFPRLLTVLNYHRVVDYKTSGFLTFKQNVSATPEDFELQMEYVSRFYNVISVKDLVSWIRERKPLPPKAALITFDDGYDDNYENAYPILKKYGFTAVIFLATDYMEKPTPFFWDYAAYCFNQTQKNQVRLPSGLNLSWDSPATRDKIVAKWVHEVKYLFPDDKQRALDKIGTDLDVSISSDAFNGLYLNWYKIREMSKAGIEFGAHTASHPILTKIPLSQAEYEVFESKRRVEEEIGVPTLGFAYPNGGRLDFSNEIVSFVKKAGFEVAFTLLPGPTRHSSSTKDPFRIRRVYIGRADNMYRFAAKLAGGERAVDLAQSY